MGSCRDIWGGYTGVHTAILEISRGYVGVHRRIEGSWFGVRCPRAQRECFISPKGPRTQTIGF